VINQTFLLCRLTRSPVRDASLTDRLRAQSWSNCIRGGRGWGQRVINGPQSVGESSLSTSNSGLVSRPESWYGVWRCSNSRSETESPPKEAVAPGISAAHALRKRPSQPIPRLRLPEFGSKARISIERGFHAGLSGADAGPSPSPAAIGVYALLHRLGADQQTSHPAGLGTSVPGMPSHLRGR